MSNDRTFEGTLIDTLIGTVEKAETTTRQKARPTFREAEAPKYWSVKHQDWLSLDEMVYLKQIALDKETK